MIELLIINDVCNSDDASFPSENHMTFFLCCVSHIKDLENIFSECEGFRLVSDIFEINTSESILVISDALCPYIPNNTETGLP